MSIKKSIIKKWRIKKVVKKTIVKSILKNSVIKKITDPPPSSLIMGTFGQHPNPVGSIGNYCTVGCIFFSPTPRNVSHSQHKVFPHCSCCVPPEKEIIFKNILAC